MTFATPLDVTAPWQSDAHVEAGFLAEYVAVCAGGGNEDPELGARARAARERGAPAVVCDLTTLRALRSLVQQRLDDATQLARTATRMARTESLRDSECFASVVLARARRLHGETHRALQILRALLRYAPPAWHAWIEWELVLAGGRTWTEGATAWAPASAAAAALADWLDAARRGDRAAWAVGRAALRANLGAHPLLLHDIAAVAAALDVEATTEEAPDGVAAWRAGTQHELPWGLAGVCASAQPVFVSIRPGHGGTRTLDAGLEAAAPGVERVTPTRAQSRPDALLSVLALADAPTSTATLFERTYGFAFVPGTHQGVFDVLLHRTRARFDASVRIVRTGDAYALEPLTALLVPDPRSGPKDDDRVLQLVAVRGTLTAREAAESLGVSLRKAQIALDSLAESGACVQAKRGRLFEYRVEDTTFQEPTDVRGRD